MSDGPALAELQRRFFELVTGPQGIAQELARRGIPEPELAAIIAGDARASAVERLDVYANMYFFRILEVLRADYPKLAAVVGAETFHDLATDYLQAHPSRHPSLRFVGAALPDFLARHALGATRAWLAELAALEWARVDVFDRADAEVLAHAALSALAPEAFAALALAPVPACALARATRARVVAPRDDLRRALHGPRGRARLRGGGGPARRGLSGALARRRPAGSPLKLESARCRRDRVSPLASPSASRRAPHASTTSASPPTRPSCPA